MTTIAISSGGSVGGVQRLSRDPTRPAPTETAVIVPVPAAEPLVGSHRNRLDPSARWGVPAHVTVLYPFVEPAQVDDRVVHTLAAAVRPVDGFVCRFARTRWFGDEVLWLDPEPAAPFRALTAAVWAAFPAYPPYAGAHDDAVPHLTVGETRAADLTVLRAAEHAVQGGLPVTTRIDEVVLIAGTQAPDSWHALHTFPLDGGRPDRR